MRDTILIVDDEADIVSTLADYFLYNDYNVMTATSGTEAIEKAERQPDIILLDINMPDVDGLEVCARIRDFVRCPILFLTARVEDSDKIKGFGMGGDDYVVKPFSLIELTARIKANIRRARTYQAIPSDAGVKIKDLEIDPISHIVSRQGTLIDLTPIEFEILHLLATHPGQAFSKERLYELIWREPYFGNENVLNTHINRLRLKLKNGEEDTTTYIKTLWGLGYKMEDN